MPLITGNTYTQWFRDGLVPTSDVIDAAHRNGVPIYGTPSLIGLPALRIRNDLQSVLKKILKVQRPFLRFRKLAELAKYCWRWLFY